MKVLAVIPARGGSKGIPRKNVRLMNGKPLMAYAVSNAVQCPAITDVAVSSDDAEILAIGKKYGAVPLQRSQSLARDAVTLDPVIYDAMVQMEERNGYRYDVVITLQATSPLLTPSTLNRAVDEFLQGDCDTFISATNQPHLSWSKNEDGYFPLYEKRLNRQQLPPHYLEAGAFLISRREVVTQNSRIGKKVSVYEIPEEEATDIDTVSDWIVCENRLKRKHIVLRCDGHKVLGMGHIYRGLTLAYHLMGHDVLFVTREDCKEGLQKIRNSFFPCRTIRNDEDFFQLLRELHPDIVVNDCLDTEAAYIERVKELVPRVVTFEDLGAGAAKADAVINALYESEKRRPNEFFGKKYIDLRDEFLVEDPVELHDEVKKVFVMFGGIDPSNLTQRIYQLAKDWVRGNPDLHFTFVVGLSYDCEGHGVVSTDGIEVHQEVRRVTELMRDSDLAFTSQGRTVFELACMGIPSIVLAQNEREQTHVFAQMQNGFLNLGLGREVHNDTIDKTFRWLCSAHEIRKDMYHQMMRHDLRGGIERIIKIVLGE